MTTTHTQMSTHLSASNTFSDGIMADPSGTLIYKPCTKAEISFYQSTVSKHPEFARLMPAFIGTLEHGQSAHLQDLLSTNPGQETADMKSMLLHTADLENKAALSAESESLKRGKKLDTELVIVLENVLAGFKRPNFMDVKLGMRLWADDAPPAKRARLDDVASKTTSSSLGFRVAGMQVWEPTNSKTGSARTSHTAHTDANVRSEEGKYRSYDKLYGRSLTEHNVQEAFATLLPIRSDKLTREYADNILQGIDSLVEEIESVVASNESRMYSASLLLVFEADAEARQETINAAIAKAEHEATKGGGSVQNGIKNGRYEYDENDPHDDDNEGEEGEDDEDEDEEEPKRLFDVKVIDFAHADWVPGQGPDENFLFGVRNVRKVLQGLARSHNGMR